jgi:formate hydrogenlyase subunit 6/NADH:ubiquinone oxidoreductase subunit I
MAFIIIPIRYGYVERGTFIGWVAVKCNYCQTIQPHGCYDVSRHETLYSVKVMPSRRTSKRLVCSFCNESFDVPTKTSITLEQNWNPQQGIQQLVNSTNPALGVADKKLNRSNNEIKAILTRMEEWTNYAFHNENLVKILLGASAIISFVLGSFIGVYLPEIEGISSFIIYGVSFALIGCIITYFIAKH